MTFETFSADGLQQLSDAIIKLSLGKFLVEDLFLYLEVELSDNQFEALIGECGYEPIFT